MTPARQAAGRAFSRRRDPPIPTNVVAGPRGQSIEWVTDPDRFAAIAPAWDRLAHAHDTPFLTSTWVLAWWRTLAGPRGMRIGVLWRDGEVAAGLPLVAEWRRWTTAATDDAPLTDLVAVDDRAREQLAADALERAPGMLRVRGLPEPGPGLDALLGAARDARCWILPEPPETSLVIDTAGRSFEDYRRALSSKARSETGRLRRKAEREHAVDLAPLDTPSDLDAELQAVLALEASGWKGRNGTAVISQPALAAFFRDVCRDFHARDALRLSTLRLDGRLAAMGINLLHDGRVFTLRVAYDEDLRTLGPSFVLLMATVERCCELGLAGYEFCGRPEEYERRFATGERGHRHVRVYRPSVLAAARYAQRPEGRRRLQEALPLAAVASR